MVTELHTGERFSLPLVDTEEGTDPVVLHTKEGFAAVWVNGESIWISREQGDPISVTVPLSMSCAVVNIKGRQQVFAGRVGKLAAFDLGEIPVKAGIIDLPGKTRPVVNLLPLEGGTLSLLLAPVASKGWGLAHFDPVAHRVLKKAKIQYTNGAIAGAITPKGESPLLLYSVGEEHLRLQRLSDLAQVGEVRVSPDGVDYGG